MKHVHIDIETYSNIDLIKSNVYKYVQGVDFEILMLAYSFFSETKIVDLKQGENYPAELLTAFNDDETLVYAHNANFERVCLRSIGINIPVERWRCTQVMAAYHGLPLSLGKLSTFLNLKEASKDRKGKDLIKLFTVPCKPTKKNGYRVRNLPEHYPEKWQQFKDYCVQDVVAEMAIEQRLPFYIPKHVWGEYATDQEINDRGIKCDLDFVDKCISHADNVKTELMQESIRLTGLKNPNSVTQLKTWIKEQTGMEIGSLAADLIPEYIEQFRGNETVVKVLEMRQQLSKSSVKKYNTIKSCANADNRLRGSVQFLGAARTGRWAGRGVQVHNLPRNYLKPIPFWRNLVRKYNTEQLGVFGEVNDILKDLIRTSFVSGRGKDLLAVDFSSIEARVLAWLAGESWVLDVFRTHGKIYEATASNMFGIPLESVTKDSEWRMKGKIATLALGYQGGVGALKQMDKDKKIKENEMQGLVNQWRSANPSIKKFWYDVERCAMLAIRQPNTEHTLNGRLSFIYESGYLRIKLPSNRYLNYPNARIGYDKKFGKDTIEFKTMSGVGTKFEKTYGGKLVENITQAVARDLLAFSLENVKKNGYNTVLHVHDELVIEGENLNLDSLICVMCEKPLWADTLPIKADGFISKFYKK